MHAPLAEDVDARRGLGEHHGQPQRQVGDVRREVDLVGLRRDHREQRERVEEAPLVGVVLERDDVEVLALGELREPQDVVRGGGGGRDEDAEAQVMSVIGHRASLHLADGSAAGHQQRRCHRRRAAPRRAQPRAAAGGAALPLTPVGLHYLLIHYDIPAVDPDDWRLRDRRRRRAAADALARRPASAAGVTRAVTLECAGNGRALLRAAAAEPAVARRGDRHRASGPACRWRRCSRRPDCATTPVEVLFTGAGPRHRGRRRAGLPAQPPARRGARARRAARLRDERRAAAAAARLPAAAGDRRLVRHGARQVAARRSRALDRAVRRLPAGGRLPDVRRRRRRRRAGHADHAALADGPARASRTSSRARARSTPGRARLRGRAWSGWAPIARVEVSVDDGATWADAALDEPLGERAWRGWSLAWDAAPGEHVVSSRATDAAGNVQPLEPPWNLKGYANNVVERIPVTVRTA